MDIFGETWPYMVGAIGCLSAMLYVFLDTKASNKEINERRRQSDQRAKTAAEGEPMATIKGYDPDAESFLPFEELQKKRPQLTWEQMDINRRFPKTDTTKERAELPARPVTRPPSVFFDDLIDEDELEVELLGWRAVLAETPAPLTEVLRCSTLVEPLDDDEAQTMADALSNLIGDDK